MNSVLQESPPPVLSVAPLVDVPALARDWHELEARAARDTSFFLSWLWIGCWLDHLGAHDRPLRLTVREADGAVVGLAVMIERTRRRFGLRTRRQWWLHETGDRALDCLCMEYNGILVAAARASEISTVALGWLAKQTGACDELILGGIGTELTGIATMIPGRLPRVIARAPCPWLSLDAVRRAGGEPLALFGPSTRAALRRCRHLYSDQGPVRFYVAATEAEAGDFLTELKDLHQRDWNARGKPGAFASPCFEHFHRTLIRRAFADGVIELCRVSVGDRTIGMLYNFVWRGRVYAYQSGFERPAGDNRLKPGLLSHYLAIHHALAAGRERYDFMAGDGRHKRSLSDNADLMSWLALDSDGAITRLEHRVRRWLGR
ncbi:MAG: GNAT family N-acetyltransferase [Rhodospirillaceae bacterium]